MSLSGNSNICIILMLMSIHCLFQCESRLSWFLVCWVILDYMLDILNLMIWDSQACLSLMENVNIFVLVGNWAGWVEAKNSVQLSVRCDFNISFIAFTDLSCICTTQWPIWDLGGGLSLSSILKVFYMLFRIRSTHAKFGSFCGSS